MTSSDTRSVQISLQIFLQIVFGASLATNSIKWWVLKCNIPNFKVSISKHRFWRIFIFSLRLSPRDIWVIFKFDFCVFVCTWLRNYHSFNYHLILIVWYVVADVSRWWYVWGVVTHWTRDRADWAGERTEAGRAHWEDFTLYTHLFTIYTHLRPQALN